MSDHERRVYLNHIRRLQEHNRVLGEILACERIARQRAYKWYSKRLRSHFWVAMDMVLMHGGKLGLFLLAILHLEAHGK